MRIPWSARGSTRGAGRGGSPPTLWRKGRLLLIPAMGLAVICQLSLSGAAASAANTRTNTPTAPSGSVAPNATNELDCNGWSAKYKTVRKLAGDLCTDPISLKNGQARPFIDNGWYVGHDEPDVKFISNTPGSGNTMTYYATIPVDPSKAPTPSGSVTKYGELSIAPWFGLPMCDPNSYPQNPCKPDSDSNGGMISDPNAAGSAFMELQLYPPGYTPFVDSESCSVTKWCAALTIDSLECSFNFATCNANCEEPVNFAYLQTNGVPTGPPSPQLTDLSTFTPNSNTLLINQGDQLQISITDPPQGFTTTIRDLSTGQTGYMVASASNGFMNTNINTCDGTPFTFHAEYSSAKQINQVPWAALEGGVLMQQEIGHSESCSSLLYQDPFSFAAGGQSYYDADTYQTCVGGSEGPGQVGEGPCSNTTGLCQNAETEGPSGPVACPTDNSATGAHCEFADAFCFPKGARTVTENFGSGPVTQTEYSANNQCFADRYQNGDLDFDGLSYQTFTWPNGGPNHPTAMQYTGPFQASGSPYPVIQFQSDIAGSEALCNTATGLGCVVKPIGSNFYPFWSLSSKPGAAPGSNCVWNFGNTLPNTVRFFGGDAEYGTADLSRYAGTVISNPMPNPAYANVCAAP
jgi:hypothetical protein